MFKNPAGVRRQGFFHLKRKAVLQRQNSFFISGGNIAF
ncbi:hypothetical protein U471_09170 [Bacillus amyloliquefaciens CC178]|nr:hypothetical protein U471_09170 [Bacillus amyloliquefaciens CC178]RAP05539.1 hypothetical protein HS9_01683 [Bacillus velezensis]